MCIRDRAYTQLKERTAGVELEAHRRAQAIQEKAEGDARKVRRQVEQWLQGCLLYTSRCV